MAKASPTRTAAAGAATRDPQALDKASASEAATNPDEASELTTLPTDPQAQAEEDAGVRSPDGSGTRQREMKPEDYPAEARVTPAAEQLNTSAAQSVGHAPAPQGAGIVAEAAQQADAAQIEARREADKAHAADDDLLTDEDTPIL